MLKEDYIEYSGITNELFDIGIDGCSDLIKKECSKLYVEDKYEYISEYTKFTTYDNFKSINNVDKQLLINKLKLFSPHLLSLIYKSDIKTCLEHIGGFGILSEIIKENNPHIEVTYSNNEGDMFRFVNWRYDKYQNDIKTLLLEDFKIIDTYDVIISDGVLQYFSPSKQLGIISNIKNSLSKGGLLGLLIDISGSDESKPLYHDVDIVKTHSFLEYSDMICIYGKNTFSSLWKKQN